MKFEDWATVALGMCHRHRISEDDVLGCYHCCDTFLGYEVEEWINEQKFGGSGETAICPHCGIDAVLKIEDILEELCKREFGRDNERP